MAPAGGVAAGVAEAAGPSGSGPPRSPGGYGRVVLISGFTSPIHRFRDKGYLIFSTVSACLLPEESVRTPTSWERFV
ncbi:hypothetical protein GCM10010246_71870 [Streptomyces cuspidosporus]|uniref:Uncharacterized protein n=1 Tax=Streptomyces cuspidosporus TaxID=66882 RepID=A0ABP5U2J1_9ACTN